MLTRLREGTPDAADRGRAGAASADLPEAIGGAPLSIGKLGHSFGELRAIERIDLEVEPGEVVGNRRPVGLRQDHAAGAGRGVAACGRRDHLGRRPHRPGREARALRVHAAAGPPPPLALCRRQRIPGSSDRRAAADTSARSGRGALRAARAGGLRGLPPGRALRRDAPAGRIPSHLDGGAAGPPARRAVRLARCDHQGGDAVLARRACSSPTGTPSCSSPMTSRRPSTSPTRCWCSASARLAWSTGSR